MILYEFEGKKLLSDKGIKVPPFQIVDSATNRVRIKFPLVLKAQVLSGKRKDAGGIIFVNKKEEFKSKVKELLGKKINGEIVTEILAEEIIKHRREFYLALSYDTGSRSVVLTFSESGGTGIENRESKIVPIDILNPQKTKVALPSKIQKILPKLIKSFLDNDLLLLEINPLVIDGKGNVFALDAKVKLDDTAMGRHKEWNYSPRSIHGHNPTKREIEAKKIDEGDYKGTAGSTYFDLPGDIAVLASGGGASLTAMDALVKAGGAPANYTEYSGNPSKEKVAKLTKIVLSKKGINGLWVVGAIANFTNIFETLTGFVESLRNIKPKPEYPIVIRRGGPHDKEAFAMLRKVKDFDLHLYGEKTSIVESAKIMSSLAKKYASTKK